MQLRKCMTSLDSKVYVFKMLAEPHQMSSMELLNFFNNRKKRNKFEPLSKAQAYRKYADYEVFEIIRKHGLLEVYIYANGHI